MRLADYTTQKIIDALILDVDASKEEKDIEKAKMVISDDAFALCDFINVLIKKIEHTRTYLK